MTTLYSKFGISIKKLTDDKYNIMFNEKLDFMFNYIFDSLTDQIDITKDQTIDTLLNLDNIHSIQTLPQFLLHYPYGINFNITLKFLEYLAAQLFYLERINKNIIFYDLESILIINNKIPIFINSSLIFDIVDDKTIIDVPFTLSDFVAPELSKIKTLPYEVYYTCSYYSLALLIYFLLFNKHLNLKEYDQEFAPIAETSMYWCLNRCLNKDPRERIFLFI